MTVSVRVCWCVLRDHVDMPCSSHAHRKELLPLLSVQSVTRQLPCLTVGLYVHMCNNRLISDMCTGGYCRSSFLVYCLLAGVVCSVSTQPPSTTLHPLWGGLALLPLLPVAAQ